jgi:hypothetical protein
LPWTGRCATEDVPVCHPSRGGIWHGAKAVFINRSMAKILGQNERKGPD